MHVSDHASENDEIGKLARSFDHCGTFLRPAAALREYLAG
jgi:hypothetical protein